LAILQISISVLQSQISSVSYSRISKKIILLQPKVAMWLQENRVAKNFNGQLLFATGLMMLSQINFGMDLAAFANTQAMDSFSKKFGSLNPKTHKYHIDPYFLSLLNSLTYVGQVFGVVTGGYINRKYGRRPAFYVMSVWAITAAILLVTAQNKEQILVGRIVNYIYLGQELVTIPVMQSEIVPPKIRGMVVGTYQLGVMVRTIISG
jgi:SP family sugar:H+ symporter-like MFS transporter